MVFALFYGIIAIHDIPHLIAKSRDHPHQDAIHAAGWVSLFRLHALWPFVWIWAMAYRPDRGWGVSLYRALASRLHYVGDKGRDIIGEMYLRRDDRKIEIEQARRAIAGAPTLEPVTQTLTYSGKPRTVASYDVNALIREAQKADAVIVMASAVGDTLVENAVILRVLGGWTLLPEERLMQGLHLETERTFHQDPKFPIRLLVDIAIKALSPAINDPTTAVQTIDQIEDRVHESLPIRGHLRASRKSLHFAA